MQGGFEIGSQASLLNELLLKRLPSFIHGRRLWALCSHSGRSHYKRQSSRL